MSEARSAGVALAATFTSDGLRDALARRLRESGREIQAAPYGQLVEPMLDPDSVLLSHAGVNLLLVRAEDLYRGAAHPSAGDRLLDELLSVLSAAPTRSAATWLVALTPPSPGALADPAAARWIETAARRIAGAVEPLPGMHLVPLDDLAERYEVPETHDEYADRIAHLPYSDAYFEALADWLVRLAATTWHRPRKVVVLDCDNTLWTGVCGEDGPLGVEIGPGRRKVQEFMLDQRARGKLLCLCSRNEEADVRAVFAGNPGMALAMEDVTAHRIGWQPKAQYLAELSAELGLALNSFVFVDDDAVECASVRAQLPEVAVVELTRDDDAAARQLARETAFDQLTVTDEDRLRADWYGAEPQRRELERSVADYEEFLARCAIEVTMTRLTDAALDRAAQLTSRTTQFTLAGTAFTVPELRRLLDEGGQGWTVRVSDVFGDYGTVGLVLARADGGVLDVPVFLLSCRVLNRQVETRMLRMLGEKARAAGCRTMRLPYRPTRRNAPARRFLQQISGSAIGAEDACGVVEVRVADWCDAPVTATP
ncbi:type I polyketide synthase (plasmid) [Streptomyces griseofuscus]|uniref:Type I polyketide synthase n=2 Tax=Streptomyces TaxID=1883 RepID=A0A7H1QCU7_9ACTN|nr:HAD-IIIC family phosphatase [Streptomyces griseofuscus]ADN64237.1 putative glyceryl-PCP synthase [Streptomyces rochei subsp. volubilis]QNT98127.1 type I polyketide synthase [Streptomyces griseofuscus]